MRNKRDAYKQQTVNVKSFRKLIEFIDSNELGLSIINYGDPKSTETGEELGGAEGSQGGAQKAGWLGIVGSEVEHRRL